MYNLELEKINKLIDDISASHRSVTKHYVVKWTLSGVLDASYSPTFQCQDINLGNDIGSCFLKATPNFAKNYLFVEMSMDVVKNSYFLNYRFGFQTRNGIFWHEDHTMNFTENFALSNTCETLSNYYNRETESFDIFCQIMITTYAPVPGARVSSINDRHAIAICVDFYVFFYSNYLSDIILCVGENEISAHKAILTSKSKVFLKLVEEMDSSQSNLELSETNVDIVRSMLLFMYTGNFEIWEAFFSPTIALYECVTKYEITDLKAFLSPVEIKLIDVCLIKESELTWSLQNEFIRNLSLYESPLFRTQFGSFRLKLFTENTNEDTFGIRIEPFNVLENMTLILKTQIFDKENKIFMTKSLKCSFKEGSKEEHVLNTVMKSDLMTSFVEPVMPFCNIFILGGHVRVSNYEICHRVSSRTKETKSCDKLTDFGCLLDKNKFSDFKLYSSGNLFLVHKAILGGRSTYFKDLFLRIPDIKSMNITDLPTSAVEKFLVYLYSGKIGPDLETHLDLLLAFDKYLVSTLGAHLYKALPHEVSLENVCTVLLTLKKLKNIDYFQDLRSASISLLCSNFNEIESSQNWENILSQNEELAREILLNLQEAYTD